MQHLQVVRKAMLGGTRQQSSAISPQVSSSG
jgi:hypothetical protein